MLKESGRIIGINEINGEKIAIVECISKSACKSCASNDNCGVGVVAKGLNDKAHHISIPFKDGMVINETIELLIENKDVVKSSLIVYIIPLLSFVIGTIFSYLFFKNEPLIIITSLIFLAAGVFVAKKVSAKLYPIDTLSSLISTK
jgi:sigma-E factor negative regulatory protein RseC